MIVVSENKVLFDELWVLLREDSVALPLDRAVLAPRILGLQERIRANVRRRLSEIASNVSSSEVLVHESSFGRGAKNRLYDDLKGYYREAMALAVDCSKLKKIMRAQR